MTNFSFVLFHGSQFSSKAVGYLEREGFRLTLIYCTQGKKVCFVNQRPPIFDVVLERYSKKIISKVRKEKRSITFLNFFADNRFKNCVEHD